MSHDQVWPTSQSNDTIASASPSDAVSSTPCGLPGACESSNPTYRVYYSTSVGDSSSCRFELHIDWGDGSQETDVTAGASAGVLVLIGSHTYGAPGTYSINVSGKVLSGPCTVSPSAGQFTLVRGGPSRSEQGAAMNPSQKLTTCSSVLPVNCATGTFWHTFTDASIPGLGIPLNLTRTYGSDDAATTGPLGYGWTNSYSMHLSFDGTNVTVAQENGSTVPFYGVSGTYFPGAGVLASLVENGDGTYTFTRDSTNTRYLFNDAGQLLEEIDRNGYATTLTYSGSDLTEVTDQAGRSLTFAYSGGHIVSMSDPMGYVTTYTYDAAGNLASTVDPLGRTWSFTYDPDHRLLTMTDPMGGVTTNTYDSSDRVTAQVDPMGRTTTWSYAGEPESASGGTTTITDPRGVQTEQHYTNLELTAVTAGVGTPQAATTSYEYDMATLGLTKITDPNGSVTTQTYDSRGDLLTTTDPLAHVATYAYDPDGDLLTSTDPLGTTTSYAYDANGNLLSRSMPLPGGGTSAWSFTYGTGATAGDRLTAKDPNGNTTQFGYDAAGNVTSTTDPMGHQATASYDEDGRLLSRATPKGRMTTYAYDADGEPTSETGPLGETTTSGYDANGNPVSTTDANGHTTKQTFNADGELTQVTRPDGSILKTERDADGNTIAQIDGAGHATTYAYDPLGRVISTTDPDGHSTSYRYDAAGHETAMVNAEGETTEYVYDAGGELTNIGYSDPTTPDVSATYDADGRRTKLTDGTGTSEFTYDSLGRMISSEDGAGAVVRYGYDPAGELTTLTYPNGQSVTRGYDAAGNLTSVTDWQGHTSNFSYDSDGNLSEEQHPGNVVTQRGYDDAGRLTTITDTKAAGTLASFGYTRDPAGQVTSEVSQNGETAAINYSRNSLDQLTAANSTAYGYDAADNPTTFGAAAQHFDPANELTTIDGPDESKERESPGSGGSGETLPPPPPSSVPKPTPRTGSYCRHGFRKKRVHGKSKCVKKKKKKHAHSTHRARAAAQAAREAASADSSDERRNSGQALVSVASGSGSRFAARPPAATTQTSSTEFIRHFAYNERGDRIMEELAGGGTRSLTYDQANRLTAVGSGISYAYNGNGLRASKTVNGVTTAEVWNQAEALPELLQAGSTSYVYGPSGRPIEQIAGGAATFLQLDQHNSIRLLTDASGAVVGRYDYDPWGNVTKHTGSSASDLQFDGQLTDGESGYQYLRSRYFDPRTGQFLTPDPLLPLTRSRFGFGANHPIDRSDPLGLGAAADWAPTADWSKLGYSFGDLGLKATCAAFPPDCEAFALDDLSTALGLSKDVSDVLTVSQGCSGSVRQVAKDAYDAGEETLLGAVGPALGTAFGVTNDLSDIREQSGPALQDMQSLWSAMRSDWSYAESLGTSEHPSWPSSAAAIWYVAYHYGPQNEQVWGSSTAIPPVH
jgi:RHS repeat-associated protein